VARRRAQQQELLSRARHYAAGLDRSLDVQAVVVFGSVARGDFNAWSDIDVLVVAQRLPDQPVARLRTVGSPAAEGVEAVVWTPREWALQHRRGNPVAVEAATEGVWLVGERSRLDDWLAVHPDAAGEPGHP
jgi:predicted nucleotidyltransferase